MQDCKGQEIEEGCEVAVAGQGQIWTGIIVRIRPNNGSWYQRCQAERDKWAKDYVDNHPVVYTIRREGNKTSRIDNYRRILVLTPKKK